MFSIISDTQIERNMLIKDVYPKLKEYCRSKYALDFQVNALLCRLCKNTYIGFEEWSCKHFDDWREYGRAVAVALIYSLLPLPH